MRWIIINKAVDYISDMKYDQWILFHFIPEDIKGEVILRMDECMNEHYTFIWEGDWFKKTLRNLS